MPFLSDQMGQRRWSWWEYGGMRTHLPWYTVTRQLGRHHRITWDPETASNTHPRGRGPMLVSRGSHARSEPEHRTRMLRTTRHTPGDTHTCQRHTAQQGPRTTSAHAPTRVRLRNKADRRRHRGMPGKQDSYRKCRNGRNYGGNQWEVVVTCPAHHVTVQTVTVCVQHTPESKPTEKRMHKTGSP